MDNNDLKEMIQAGGQLRMHAPHSRPIEVYLTSGMRCCFHSDDVKIVAEHGEVCEVHVLRGSEVIVLNVQATYDEALRGLGAEPRTIGDDKPD
jgi:hypothetical protein